jgi:hypothetical protein
MQVGGGGELQARGGPDAHVPAPSQASLTVHSSPSLHAAPAGALVLGHWGAAPSQKESASHWAAAASQRVPAGSTLSGRQEMVLPSHVSATSQGPATGLHTAVASFTLSRGHLKSVPGQVSASSQGPAAGLHTVACGSVAQTPAMPGRLQDWQSPGSLLPQALAQHTPSEQNVETHCEPVVQGEPVSSAGL